MEEMRLRFPMCLPANLQTASSRGQWSLRLHSTTAKCSRRKCPLKRRCRAGSSRGQRSCKPGPAITDYGGREYRSCIESEDDHLHGSRWQRLRPDQDSTDHGAILRFLAIADIELRFRGAVKSELPAGLGNLQQGQLLVRGAAAEGFAQCARADLSWALHLWARLPIGIPMRGRSSGGPSVLDPTDFRQEYGTSSLDVRHSATAAVILQTQMEAERIRWPCDQWVDAERGRAVPQRSCRTRCAHPVRWQKSSM